MISAEERLQVKMGSSTSLGVQLINLVREVADRLILGVVLGLTESSPYSLPLLFLRILSTANFLSSASELERRETSKGSE